MKKDLVGLQFGRLTVISKADDRVSPSGKLRKYWNCLCTCGKQIEVRSDALSLDENKGSKSCGCLTREVARNNIKKAQAVGYKKKPKDISGQLFGRLTPIRLDEPKVTPKGRKLPTWLCDCKCGNTFVTLHDSLLQGKALSCGCVLPEYIDSIFKDKTEVFVHKANQVHNNRYDYSESIFEHSQKDVKIICKIHGSFFQKPNNHLNGTGCMACSIDSRKSTKEDFIEKANRKYNNKFDYSLVNYIDRLTPVEIICPTHGTFSQRPDVHLTSSVWGCRSCGNESMKVGLEEFINRSKQIHGDRYDYSKVEYIDGRIPVEIGCSVHGAFFQKPSIHANGSKCPKCSSEERASKQHWDYIERCKLNPELAESDALLYWLRVELNGESFYKIGISSSFTRRLAHYREEGLSYEVLDIIEGTALECAEMERKVLKEIKEQNLRFIPTTQFSGWTECCSTDGEEFLYELFEEYKKERVSV